jgi:Ca2+-transporting ATPase
MNINTKPDMSQGLSETQAQEKIAKEGFNELPSSKPRNLFSIALGMVQEPMFLLLVACGTLYLILGDLQEGLMLLGFVFVIMWGLSSIRKRRRRRLWMP